MTWLPPVGTYAPLRVGLSPLRARRDETERLQAELAQAFEGVDAFAFRTGRAALSTALEALAKGRQGRGVIIPAYTCFSVPSAVARAGLLAYPADIRAETLDYDYRDRSNPPPEEVFAVVSPGLFGIPSDLGILEQICTDQRLFLIEDAAQTFGAFIDERPAGTFGDATLFSFGRGKPIGTLYGGCLVAHRRSVADQMEQNQPRLKRGGPTPIRTALESVILSLSLRRGIFGMVRLLPFLHLGASVYQPDFPVEGLDPAAARLIRASLRFKETIVARRREIAAEYDHRLLGTEGVIFPRCVEGNRAAYLRYPIVFEDPADRDAVLYRFSDKGLGVSTMYPLPVHKIEKAREILRTDLGPYPGAEKVARGIITLPTHMAVRPKDMDEMAKIIREITSAGGH